MKYELILFDADDTLFDFKRSEEAAFEILLNKHQLTFKGHYLSSYKLINEELWSLESQGKITKENLKTERFKRFLELHNLEADPIRLGHDYISILPDVFYILPDATEVIATIAEKTSLAIVTNGIGVTQKERLKRSGLEIFFKTMTISEECGFSKPDPRIFEYTLNKLSKKNKSNVLMVGDKLETDILGANLFNIDSCWFNPNKSANLTQIKPTIEINSLKELLTLF